ncbi:hypothetical protein D2U88_09990 [Flagellimonas aequoris]|uniref:Uncharacterized protein n=1 Tax=Flagellimonas aequoris TaxID=2306997 RepID=A0A418N7I3_9FLAO|nr:hypothetical protein D2U88_09990 [Allomuricauda aequoris]
MTHTPKKIGVKSNKNLLKEITPLKKGVYMLKNMFFDHYPLLFVDFFCSSLFFLLTFGAETLKLQKNDCWGTKRNQEQ